MAFPSSRVDSSRASDGIKMMIAKVPATHIPGRAAIHKVLFVIVIRNFGPTLRCSSVVKEGCKLEKRYRLRSFTIGRNALCVPSMGTL